MRRLCTLTLAFSALVSVVAAPASAQSTLVPSDVSYRGFIDVRTNGNDSTYGQALTHRYVNGELRFLTLTLAGVLHEFSITGKGYGSTVDTTTATWDLGPTKALNNFNGIWYEEAKARLWVTSAEDYTAVVRPVRITTMTLGPNGTVSNVKTVGLQGLNAKRVYGGAQPVPQWFQQQYGCGPYVVGFGGYTSLMMQGGGAAVGPTAYCIPDPAGYANGAEIPKAAYKVLLDTYPNRGVRKTLPINFFDGGDARQNPSSRPSGSPVSGASWLSPNSQGLGWFVWGDSYYNTGMWIDTGTRRGFVLIASLCKGACWYQSSTLHYDGRQFEMHIWDPATLAAGGRPDSMTELTLPNGNNRVGEGNGPVRNIAGATYDPKSGRMYLIGFPFGTDDYTGRLFVFDVNASGAGSGGSSPPPPSDTADATAPTVSLTSPAAGSAVTGTVALTASAGDNVGVAGVWFTVDGSTVGAEDSSSPYQASWNATGAASGTHVVRAVARDAAGNTATSSPVSVTVKGSAPPAGGGQTAVQMTVAQCTATLSAVPPDSSGGWTVRFQRNGTNVADADSSAPYQRTVTVGAGTSTFRAVWTKTGRAAVTGGASTQACPGS
jgi:hypothetical protein